MNEHGTKSRVSRGVNYKYMGVDKNIESKGEIETNEECTE